ncbi:MAG: carbohydrate ABC transporter permease, partial [Lachnospiraceae bacterium]
MILKRKIFKAIRTFFYSVFVFIFISPIFIMLNTSLKKYEDITKWP